MRDHCKTIHNLKVSRALFCGKNDTIDELTNELTFGCICAIKELEALKRMLRGIAFFLFITTFPRTQIIDHSKTPNGKIGVAIHFAQSAVTQRADLFDKRQ